MKAWLSSVLPGLMALCQGFQLPASAWLVLLSSHFKEFSSEAQHETLEYMKFSKFISSEKHFWILQWQGLGGEKVSTMSQSAEGVQGRDMALLQVSIMTVIFKKIKQKT